LASITIAAIVTDHYSGLSYSSFLPYAVSLALRTTYRELRASTVSTIRSRAYARLQAHCHILRGLGDVYRPASSMVELVDKLVQQIDRVSANPLGIRQFGHERIGRTDAPLPPDGDHETGSAEVAEDCRSASEVALETGLTAGQLRSDIFGSLDLDFDFEALDAVFGNGSYPHLPLV
jgi:hypothetical protein